MSQYSADGMVGASRMFAISQGQWRALLPECVEKLRGAGGGATLLDVGAGDGGITANASPLFEEVTVTESSKVLTYRCWWRGFRAIEADSLDTAGLLGQECFDVVSCLNVLDRCDHPTELLYQLHACTKPGGLVVLGVVLPFCPCVMTSGLSGIQRPPKERLPIPGCCDGSGATWEVAFDKLIHVLHKAKFRVVRWTKLPYISRGSFAQFGTGLNVLNDAILVMTPIST